MTGSSGSQRNARTRTAFNLEHSPAPSDNGIAPATVFDRAASIISPEWNTSTWITASAVCLSTRSQNNNVMQQSVRDAYAATKSARETRHNAVAHAASIKAAGARIIARETCLSRSI